MRKTEKEKWQERAFPFWREYYALCSKYDIIIKDNHIVDATGHELNVEWYRYFDKMDYEVLNGPHSSLGKAK